MNHTLKCLFVRSGGQRRDEEELLSSSQRMRDISSRGEERYQEADKHGATEVSGTFHVIAAPQQPIVVLRICVTSNFELILINRSLHND